jgi:hypothetical protein
MDHAPSALLDSLDLSVSLRQSAQLNGRNNRENASAILRSSNHDTIRKSIHISNQVVSPQRSDEFTYDYERVSSKPNSVFQTEIQPCTQESIVSKHGSHISSPTEQAAPVMLKSTAPTWPILQRAQVCPSPPLPPTTFSPSK